MPFTTTRGHMTLYCQLASGAISGIIPIAIAIRIVIVLNPLAARTLPIARKILLTVMVGHNPERTLIRRTAPVACMPLIMATHRIPIASNIGISRAGTGSSNFDPRRRWRSDTDADSDTGEHASRCQQH